MQEALAQIIQPEGCSPAGADAAAADAAEDRRLAAGVRLSAEQKRMLVALRAALYTNIGRHRPHPCRRMRLHAIPSTASAPAESLAARQWLQRSVLDTG